MTVEENRRRPCAAAAAAAAAATRVRGCRRPRWDLVIVVAMKMLRGVLDGNIMSVSAPLFLFYDFLCCWQARCPLLLDLDTRNRNGVA